jgi:hypothetical protein
MIFFKCKHEIQGGGERKDEKKKKRQLVTIRVNVQLKTKFSYRNHKSFH